MTARTWRDLWLILPLLAATVVFTFWIVPRYVPIESRFVQEAIMSARFVPYFSAALMTAVLIARLAHLGLRRGRMDAAEDEPEWRFRMPAVLVFTLAAVFAFAGIDYLGFYLSGALVIAVSAFLLGERRLRILGIVSVGVVATVYGAFDLVLGVAMPSGALIAPLLKILIG